MAAVMANAAVLAHLLPAIFLIFSFAFIIFMFYGNAIPGFGGCRAGRLHRQGLSGKIPERRRG